ncbi:hypothetical protein GCM10018790_01570 [Kitasatospora xanthocidica]|uniref:hypothetical protein n=1 Tax=Kitasatospora xanthocidica TaxID=83382 RepID=UPI0016749512|nr:hypothetical protein [Kitasatospora xanthocidica]GHF27876.1 hypothetical protein GCM10018790_01570 [Kitasatospora xanthocidica]
MARLRLRYATWPRPAIHLTDTPNPACTECKGAGGWTEDYGDYDTGEYAGTEDIYCDCWNPDRTHRLLPVPNWIARRLDRSDQATWYSTEPPF